MEQSLDTEVSGKAALPAPIATGGNPPVEPAAPARLYADGGAGQGELRPADPGHPREYFSPPGRETGGEEGRGPAQAWVAPPPDASFSLRGGTDPLPFHDLSPRRESGAIPGKGEPCSVERDPAEKAAVHGVLRLAAAESSGGGLREQGAWLGENRRQSAVAQESPQAGLKEAGAIVVGISGALPPSAPEERLSDVPLRGTRKAAIGALAGAIADSIRVGKQDAVIQLEPPELGRMRVDLRVDGDKLRARIVAEGPEAKALVENHLGELRDALQAKAIDLIEIRIEQGAWRESGAGWAQGFQRQRNNGDDWTRETGAPSGRRISRRPATGRGHSPGSGMSLWV
ncbi:MAG TPA: flagellar hook-length control protein FliK [candidate division Zixibacteria bacterium]|nr:flagellar hook-length control protein FliK [candidate division Zixibacteria bacterium]